jgi:hypothetical protein
MRIFTESRRKLKFGGLLIVLVVLFVTVRAQTPDSSKKYRVYLEPYLFATSMSGTLGMGNLPNAFVCVPVSEILQYLQFGAMLYAEVHNNRFAYTSDIVYAALSQDASSKNGILSGNVKITQGWWELEGLYRLLPWLEAGVGLRIVELTTNVNLNVSDSSRILMDRSGNVSNSWVDPLIVARLSKWVKNKWLFSLRADIGGFGIGSQLAWQLQPNVGFKVSKLLQLSLGYRIITMNYTNGKSGSERFLFDVDQYGPQLRIGFNL